MAKNIIMTNKEAEHLLLLLEMEENQLIRDCISVQLESYEFVKEFKKLTNQQNL